MALTREQETQLRSLIEDRRRALIGEVREDLRRARSDSLGELAGTAPDAGDESVAMLIQDLDQAEATRDLGELRALDSATERLASGAYGICVDCGSDIRYERLRASPAALRCIRCQEMFEKTHAGTGGPTL